MKLTAPSLHPGRTGKNREEVRRRRDMCDPSGTMVEFTVTTKPDEFVQSPEEALRLLRRPCEEFPGDVRKEAGDIAHIAV